MKFSSQNKIESKQILDFLNECHAKMLSLFHDYISKKLKYASKHSKINLEASLLCKGSNNLVTRSLMFEQIIHLLFVDQKCFTMFFIHCSKKSRVLVAYTLD